MTTDITELAQSNELLIANGNETANLLRHLANNEIDSDYFAVVSECEAYGQETDAEISITEFALRAAGYVDALVEALEREVAMREQNLAIKLHMSKRIAELESRTVTVKMPEVRITVAESRRRNMTWRELGAYNEGADVAAERVGKELTAQGIKWEVE